ncbi:MAG: type VI secretion protein IcmF/TssM N-terminal domain-containing protein [Gemmataceae bacterium]
MLALLRWFWDRLLALFGLVLPMLGWAGAGLRSSVAFWIFHALLMLAILGGLGWLNDRLDLPRYLRAPTGWLAYVWLPALFLLLYVNLWLGHWLRVLLRAGARPSPFPDIDAAWADVLAALDRAGLDLARVPLFLALGRPQAGGDPLFAASGLNLSPMGAEAAAVRVFAGPVGVFVYAPDCTLTGGLAEWAGQQTAHPFSGDGEPSPSPTGGPGGLPSLLAPADEAGDPDPPQAPVVPPLTKDAAEMARRTARLRHLCRLLSRTRRPYCPVNGVLVLVPAACTQSDASGGMAGLVVGQDLRTLAGELQLLCPVLGVVCDGEQLPGFTDLLRALPAGKRGQRFGRRLPYAPRLAPAERAALVADSVRWVCREVAPRLAYRVMPAATPDAGGSASLVRLTTELFRRQEVTARLFAQAFGSDEVGPVWAGGCYLAATGARPQERGFLADLFSQLVESQNLVAWTREGRATETALRVRAAVGYGLLLLVCGGVAWLTWTTFWP